MEIDLLIDDLIVKDTIELIDRLDMPKCKEYLKEMGVKGYSKLAANETRELLAKKLREQSNEYVLKIYDDNKVRLDMFKYEICDILQLSKYKLDKDIDSFTISGTQSLRAGGKMQQYNKYCRRDVYRRMFGK